MERWPSLKRLTYREMRDAYMDFCELKERKSLRFDKDGSPYLDKVKRLDGFFEDYLTRAITSDALRKFTLQLQGEGKQGSTVNRSLATLRTMFRMAIRERKIGLDAMPVFTFLTEPKPRQGLLEQKKYPELLASLPDYIKTVLALGFFTGMRRGEVLSLQWEHIDLDERLIKLDPDLTKSGESREISHERRVVRDSPCQIFAAQSDLPVRELSHKPSR
jgi:integrase